MGFNVTPRWVTRGNMEIANSTYEPYFENL
jgi:hypothetical protein